MTGTAGPVTSGRGRGSPTLDPRILFERYEAIVFDLDGVLHRGDRVISAAPSALAAAASGRVPVVFLTNNSARTPTQVAERLSGLGLPARPDQVVTSAMATAAMLAREGAAGGTAFVIGERGIREALSAVGVRLIGDEPARVDLVVVGWDRSVDYAKLRTASLLVERGARLVATNADRSFPAADGLWPGAGAILSVITTTTGAVPTIVGKPGAPMFEAAAAAAGTRRALMVGDRLDTDIAGAAHMGWDSLLVLSGATRARDLVRGAAMPTYVAGDVGALMAPRTTAQARLASADDVAAIASLLSSSGLSDNGIADRLAGTIVLEARPVAGADPRPTASNGTLATAAIVPIDDATYLRSVAVRPDLRGQGLGLLATAAALRLAGPGRVAFLVTEDRVGFFRRLGFEAVAREDAPSQIRDAAAAQGCASQGTFMRLEAPDAVDAHRPG